MALPFIAMGFREIFGPRREGELTAFDLLSTFSRRLRSVDGFAQLLDRCSELRICAT